MTICIKCKEDFISATPHNKGHVNAKCKKVCHNCEQREKTRQQKEKYIKKKGV